MTDAFPWASKHGAMNRTTGAEPAAGCARGAICWPQTLAGGRAGAAGCSQPIRVGTTHKHGSRTETQGFDDVAAAPDTAIEKNFEPSTRRGHNFRQHTQRGRDAIQLAAAVIGDDDGIGAFVHGPPGIFARLHALDDDRAAPHVADPLQIVPRHHRLRQTAGVDYTVIDQQARAENGRRAARKKSRVCRRVPHDIRRAIDEITAIGEQREQDLY